MSAQVDPSSVTVKITTGGRIITAPLTDILRRSMQPAGLFRNITASNIEHHEQVLEEVKGYILRKEIYPGLVDATWEGTISYFQQVQEQIDLCRHAQKYFDEECPLPYFLIDEMRQIELEAE